MEIAKLFKNGRSQAVRLPAAYRFEGDCVRISKRGNAIVLEPIFADTQAWFAEIDSCGGDDLFAGGREQPSTQERDTF